MQAEDLAKQTECVATFLTVATAAGKEDYTSISNAMKREGVQGHFGRDHGTCQGHAKTALLSDGLSNHHEGFRQHTTR